MGKIDFESGAVQSYLGILQSVINRMAASSAGCKTWCITLVSAIAVIVAGKSDSSQIWIALIPIFLFLFLDAYYLSMERRFRGSYNEFIKKLHSEKAEIEDVFIVSPKGGFWKTIIEVVKALVSLSIFPFYGLLVVMLWFVCVIIQPVSETSAWN